MSILEALGDGSLYVPLRRPLVMENLPATLYTLTYDQVQIKLS